MKASIRKELDEDKKTKLKLSTSKPRVEGPIAKGTVKLDADIMFTISRYLESTQDLGRLVQTVKKFGGIIDRYTYNPVPITKQTINFFPNIDTQHLYTKDEDFLKSDKIKKYVVWYKMAFYRHKQIKKDRDVDFKRIAFTNEDALKEYQLAKKKNNADDTYAHAFKIGHGITEVDDGAFNIPNPIQSVSFAPTVTTLGKECFKGNNIKDLVIPENIKNIHKECFSGCNSLTSIKIRDNKTRFLYRNRVFTYDYIKLDNIYLPNSIHIINGKPVQQLTSIEIPTKVTTLGDEIFKDCDQVKEILLETSVKNFNINIFSGCIGVTKLELLNIDKDYSHDLFTHLPNVISLTIAATWQLNGDRLIDNRNGILMSVALPTTIKEINGKDVTLSQLKEYTIPDGVTELGDYCFAHCPELSVIKGLENIKVWGVDCFHNCPKINRKKFPQVDKVIRLQYEQVFQREEMETLAEWTKRSMDMILFDSNIDDWSRNSSVFNERIVKRDGLVFLIDDENGNRFGFYLATKLEETYNSPMGANEKSFHFSFKSNGRLQGLQKFDLVNKKAGYTLSTSSVPELIKIGDIQLKKKEKAAECYCTQLGKNFNYQGLQSVLCGAEPNEDRNMIFVPKRIVVAQMSK